MAARYNQRHKVHVFNIGDIVTIKIPREDRAKTDHKRLYCKIIQKPHPERHQLLCQYGVLNLLYPTKDLQPASNLLGLNFPTLPTSSITLAHAARQASITTRVIHISCTCQGPCSTRRCRCFKENTKCTSHCHKKRSTQCQNISDSD